MKIPRIYIETTIFNFCFAEDSPEMTEVSLKLFDEIKSGKYKPYTSDYTTDELTLAPEEKRLKMLRMIDDFNIVVIEASEEAGSLAEQYVNEGVIPEKYATDALHIAAATIAELDFIVSLNFRHIVKRKTLLLTGAINAREGYRSMGIFSPAEVIEND